MDEKGNIFTQEVLDRYSEKNLHYSEEQLKTAYEDKSIVGFIDILGFSSMIKKDPKGEEFIPIVEEAIQEALRFASTMRDWDNPAELGYKIFSDNICFWMPLHHHTISVSIMLAVLAEFQLNLLRNEIFCRGGVAIGYHYSSEYVLYGPALIEAVRLEHSSDCPCISISEEIIDDIHLINLPLKTHQYHKISEEGPWFVNYLSKIFYIEKPSSLRIIKRHCDIVKEKLSEYGDDPHIRSKYEWIADYHNDIVSMIKFEEECATIE